MVALFVHFVMFTSALVYSVVWNHSVTEQTSITPLKKNEYQSPSTDKAYQEWGRRRTVHEPEAWVGQEDDGIHQV